jgi:GT2 family glycosyltransferase
MVIPTHNRLGLLRRVLGALQSQKGIPAWAFEVIVVIDGGSDGTVEALAAMKVPFRLRWIEQVRAGVAVARNTGWRAATGELVLFLDDDIVASPGLLAEHLRMHREYPTAVVLGRFSPEPGDRPSAWTRYDERVQEKKYLALERNEIPSGIRLYSGNFSVPRRLLEEVGGFDATLFRNEDVDLGFRLQALGAPFVFAPRADALHCGYHDLKVWLNRPLLYGRLDVAIYRERGYAGGLRTIVACYHDRHILNRLVIRLAFSHRVVEGFVCRLACRAGIATDRLGLHGLSYLALSAVANLRYWMGIRDGVRGNVNFWKLIKETRHYTGRPYQQAGVTPQG